MNCNRCHNKYLIYKKKLDEFGSKLNFTKIFDRKNQPNWYVVNTPFLGPYKTIKTKINI